jgi:hypothetical protein
MSNQNTTFVPQVTNITAEWCQGVNDLVWTGVVQPDVGTHITSTTSPLTGTLSASDFSSIATPDDSIAWRSFGGMMTLGTPSVAGAALVPTNNQDKVIHSGWLIRGSDSVSFCEAANFGMRLESDSSTNGAASAWAVEIDVNNESSQPSTANDGSYGFGLVMATGSTYSPGTGIWMTQVAAEGTGPGFLRGIFLDGVRDVGLEVRAMAPSEHVGMSPAAPGIITAFATGLDSEVNYRFKIDESGDLAWGAGGALTQDVFLVRSSANNLGITTAPVATPVAAGLILDSAINANAAITSNLYFYGRNSLYPSPGNDDLAYATILTRILDRTNNSEDGALEIWPVIAGSTTLSATFANGVTIASPTGGMKGAGTLNVASGYYSNGTQVVGDQHTGYGTPTNGALQASFDATSITLPNLGACVAKLIIDLKSHGLLGA